MSSMTTIASGLAEKMAPTSWPGLGVSVIAFPESTTRTRDEELRTFTDKRGYGGRPLAIESGSFAVNDSNRCGERRAAGRVDSVVTAAREVRCRTVLRAGRRLRTRHSPASGVSRASGAALVALTKPDQAATSFATCLVAQ